MLDVSVRIVMVMVVVIVTHSIVETVDYDWQKSIWQVSRREDDSPSPKPMLLANLHSTTHTHTHTHTHNCLLFL